MQMRHDTYGHHHWKADDMAAFLLDTTGIKIEKVRHRLCSVSCPIPCSCRLQIHSMVTSGVTRFLFKPG